MPTLTNQKRETFCVVWAAEGDMVLAYRHAFAPSLSTSLRKVELSAIKLSQVDTVSTRYQEILARADEIKLRAVKVDLADVTSLLQAAYVLAESLGKPGDMIKAASKLADLFALDPLAQANIDRHKASMTNEADTTEQYAALMLSLSQSLPN